MKACLCALLIYFLPFTVNAIARDTVLPAGALLQCTLNEPNFSTNTVSVGDPILCHLRGLVEFSQQAFPRGSYLVGHLEAAKNPGHFVGKGYLELHFDRIGVPSGDMPLDAKVIAAGKYKVDREGKIKGKGHAKRDAVEWMLPPLWPWKVIMLPARGPRPTLKSESVLTLRLMDDVEIPQVAQTFEPGRWHFFGQPQPESYRMDPENDVQASRGMQIPSPSSISGPSPTDTPGTSHESHEEVAIPGEPLTGRHAIGRSSSQDWPRGNDTMPSRYPALQVPAPARPSTTNNLHVAGAAKAAASSSASVMSGTQNVLALRDGTTDLARSLHVDGDQLSYTLADGSLHVVKLDDVDWTKTFQSNAENGAVLALTSASAAH